MRRIWVKATASPDPALAGKARVRRIDQPAVAFTEVPECVERTRAIERMLLSGDIEETTPPQSEPPHTILRARAPQGEE